MAEFKRNNLFSGGSSEGDEDGVWRTINGRKIFIAEGQTLEQAMADSGKFDDADGAKNGTGTGTGTMQKSLDNSDNDKSNDKSNDGGFDGTFQGSFQGKSFSGTFTGDPQN